MNTSTQDIFPWFNKCKCMIIKNTVIGRCLDATELHNAKRSVIICLHKLEEPTANIKYCDTLKFLPQELKQVYMNPSVNSGRPSPCHKSCSKYMYTDLASMACFACRQWVLLPAQIQLSGFFFLTRSVSCVCSPSS